MADTCIQKTISMPVSILNWANEESERTGIPVSKILVIIMKIGKVERDNEKFMDEETKKELIIKETPKEITPEEQAEMDKLLDAEPSEDLEKNKVSFKKVKA
jgi:hypothetical protein